MPNYSTISAGSEFTNLRSTNPSTDLKLNTGEVLTQQIQQDMVSVEIGMDNYLANTVQPAIGDGWYAIDTNETWTYSSVTGIQGTITVPSNALNRYQKGDKIRIVQGGVTKYFYIIAVTSTTITVTGGTDFTLTNVAISSIFISRIENPFGFPPSFAYTPATQSFTLGNGTLLGRFKLQSNLCYVQMALKFGSTSSLTVGQISFGSVPILASTVGSSDSSLNRQFFIGGYHDVGSNLYAVSSYIAGDGTTLTIPQLHGSSGITNNSSPIPAWATGDGVFLNGSYLI